MRFVWLAENIQHVARHGLIPSQVESVFVAIDLGIASSGKRGRWIAEGTVAGQLLRVAFTLSGPGEVHVITAYPITGRRRRT